MKNIVKVLALSLLLQGCYVSNTLGPSPQSKMEIQIENRKWLTAKVYEATPAGTTRRRIATVHLNSNISVMKHMGSRFRFLITFIGSNEIWIGDNLWSPREECLKLTIRHPLAFTNVFPCMGEIKL